MQMSPAKRRLSWEAGTFVTSLRHSKAAVSCVLSNEYSKRFDQPVVQRVVKCIRTLSWLLLVCKCTSLAYRIVSYFYVHLLQLGLRNYPTDTSQHRPATTDAGFSWNRCCDADLFSDRVLADCSFNYNSKASDVSHYRVNAGRR